MLHKYNANQILVVLYLQRLKTSVTESLKIITVPKQFENDLKKQKIKSSNKSTIKI